MVECRKRIARVVALALCTLLVGMAYAAYADEVGKPAPKLVVTELNGQTFDLAAMRGKVVVINFWATWCPPCRKEMPALDKFYQDYAKQGVELLGLSFDRERQRKNVEKVMRDYHYPAALAAEASANGFDNPQALPVTYIIDKNGFIRAVLAPENAPLSEERLAELIRPLLAAQNAPR